MDNKETSAKSSSMLNPEGFGVSNGVSTIIALQAGFLSMKTPKLYVVGALLSLLITDPLSDSYSIYISIKDSDKQEAFDKFLKTWLYQLAVQLLFLIIVIFTPNLKIAFLVSCVVGTGLVLYDYGKRFKQPLAVLREYLLISFLIIFTFSVDYIISKYNNKKHVSGT